MDCAPDCSPSDHSEAEGRLARRAHEVEGVIRRLAAQSHGLPVAETLIQRLVVLLGRDLAALLEHSLQPHGLSECDYRTLLALQSQPGGVAHPGELCASVGRSPANMTRVADGLCARGLITRIPSGEDRRRTVLRITSAGEALVRSLMPQAAQRTAEIFAGIAPAARAALLEQLCALIAGVDSYVRRTTAAPGNAMPTLSAGQTELDAPPDDG